MSLEDLINSLSVNLYSEEKINHLNRDVELEVFRNYADEIKPSIFFNTDIGDVINSQIDILSYYIPGFYIESSYPTDGYVFVGGEKTPHHIWKLTFNSEIDPQISSEDLSNYIDIKTTRKIFNIYVESSPNTIYYMNNDYIYMVVWRIVWEDYGIDGGFDVYYQFGSNAEVLLENDIKTNWCYFKFTQDMVDAIATDNIRFRIVSHEDSDIQTTSLYFLSNRTIQSGSTPTITPKYFIGTGDVSYHKVGSNNILDILEDGLIINSRDFIELTIKKELKNVNEVYFNDFNDYTINFTSLDSFRLLYCSWSDNSVTDPNTVTLRFNRKIKNEDIITNITMVGGNSVGELTNSIFLLYNITDTEITLTIRNTMDKSYTYYKLVISDNLKDIHNTTLDYEKEVIIENNHGFVYDDFDRLVILDDDAMTTVTEYPICEHHLARDLAFDLP